MDFKDLNELREAWHQGDFDFPAQMMVNSIPYKFRHGSGDDFEAIMRRRIKPYIVYQTSVEHKDAAKALDLNQWIIFVWGHTVGHHLVPYDVRALSPHQFGGSAGSKFMKEGNEEYIGDVVLLKVQLPSGVGTLKGKVDTGAEISSLHAEPGWKVVGDQVRFVNGDLSSSIISVPITDQQAVSSADGGTEYRPVIALDITVNDKPVKGALFNLNDRNQMEYPVLIGQNILDKTNFVINTRMDDGENPEAQLEWIEDEAEVDWDVVTEGLANTEQLITEQVHFKKLQEVAHILDGAPFSFKDLFRAIRTEALQRLETIDT